MKISLPKPWPEFLSEVDFALDEVVDVHCVGGFILVVLYNAPRTTVDLDYISVHPHEAAQKLDAIAGPQSKLAKKYKVYFEGVPGIADYPLDYDARIQKIELNLKRLCLWALDPYDLVLSKLTRNSPKDREDVKFLATDLKLRFDVLYARWEKEMKPWIPNAARHENTLQAVWESYFVLESTESESRK